MYVCLYVQVVLVNDPRPDNPYDHLYTVEFLNNMANAPLVVYINQPSQVLKQLAFESIKNNEVSSHAHAEPSILQSFRLLSHRRKYDYGSGFSFMAGKNFTRTSGMFMVTCTST